MAEQKLINVTSEIGSLKTVLLHRPGKELENLTPDVLERLLFDDIPYLKIAQEEHDAFADILRKNDVEVLYLEKLAAESLKSDQIRHEFVKEFINEANVKGLDNEVNIKKYLEQFNNQELVDTMMAGIRKTDISGMQATHLSSMVNSDYPFIADPMPNLYFTRDPFATMGNGITLNHMRTETRNRETLFAKYIFKYHPKYGDNQVKIWYDRDETTSIEGGDELVLSDKVIAIGISARTEAESIEKLASRILNNGQNFDTILAFDIPKKRAFMHLDTVFTMVDYDKFTIHPEIEGPLRVFAITKDEAGKIIIDEEVLKLEEILKKHLDLDQVTLIRCAGGNRIDAAREQWNDGSNTLAIAPGKVVVYSRNYVTNNILQENGIETLVMPSSELSRGRGGPRCMSMPFVRKNL